MTWLEEKFLHFVGIPYVCGGVGLALSPLADDGFHASDFVFHGLLILGWGWLFLRYRRHPQDRMRWMACAIAAGGYLLPPAVVLMFAIWDKLR